jgi:hypothetical protein
MDGICSAFFRGFVLSIVPSAEVCDARDDAMLPAAGLKKKSTNRQPVTGFELQKMLIKGF